MTTKPNKELCKLAEDSLKDSKAQNITKLELFDKSSLCDYMFIITGTSSRHVKSIATNLKKVFKELGMKHINTEGNENTNWIVLDLGDIIVHIFQSDAREVYKLEELWQNPQKDL